MDGSRIGTGRIMIWFTPSCLRRRCLEKRCRKNFTIAIEAFSALGVEDSEGFSQGKK